MGPPSYMRCVIDRNIVMGRVHVYKYFKGALHHYCDTEKFSLGKIKLLISLKVNADQVALSKFKR
jgi:hypothetical protein